MEKTILNPFQIKTLECFKKSFLAKKFYFSGGTALSEYYLHHRYSEDLDFFTKKELDLEELERFIKLITKKLNIKKIEFQKGFGLYTFFLDGNKIDFGQYPFEPVEKLKSFNGILVESLYDLALNKAHTIAFRPRLRDFIEELLKRSFEKFEMRADALQVGENLLLIKTLKDMPVMISKIDLDEIQKFFVKKIEKLNKEIFK